MGSAPEHCGKPWHGAPTHAISFHHSSVLLLHCQSLTAKSSNTLVKYNKWSRVSIIQKLSLTRRPHSGWDRLLILHLISLYNTRWWHVVEEACVLHVTPSTDTPGAMATTSADQMQLVNCTCPSPPLLPSFLPSSLLDLFLSAVWGHYGVYDLNTLFKSLLFVALALFWCICLPAWEISYQDIHFKTVYLCVGQAEINSRNVQGCPICGSSDASSSWARFPACPIITNIFHRGPLTDKHTIREFNPSG